MITNKDIVDRARDYLGAPFVHQGRSSSGVDCIGLVICVVKDLDLFNVHEIAYTRKPDGSLINRLRDHLTRTDKMIPGCVLALRLPTYPCHVAMCTDNKRIIHALSSRGRVVEHALNSNWMDRVIEIYRLPEVDYTWHS